MMPAAQPLEGVPTIDEVRQWIDTPESELPDGILVDIFNAEADTQARFCELPTGEDDGDLAGGQVFPYGMRQALFRRIARAIAARGLPLGTLPIQMTGQGIGGAAQYGAQLLPQLDAEIERYEAPFRVIALA